MSLREIGHKSADTCVGRGEEEEEAARWRRPGDLILKEEGEWAPGASSKLDGRRPRGTCELYKEGGAGCVFRWATCVGRRGL